MPLSEQRPEQPRLRLAGVEMPRRRAQIETSPAAVSGRYADPLYSVAARAVLLDITLLALAIGMYIRVMVGRGYLADAAETAIYGAALVIWWLLLIVIRGGYETRHLGIGSEEFKRVVTATVTLLAMISMASYVFKRQPPLRLVLPSLAIGVVFILLGRWMLRIWLGRQREAGRFRQATLVVGDPIRAAELKAGFDLGAVAGFVVKGTVEPPKIGEDLAAVDEWLDDVMYWVHDYGVHAVAVAESRTIHADLVRRLAWRLEGPGVDLLVSPALSDVAGPRVSVRPAAGLPLLHLDEPSLTGPKRALKRLVDFLVALPSLVLLSPLLCLIAVVIKLDSLGRALYVSERVGRSGDTFKCVKFRSMYRDADKHRTEVIGEPDADISNRYKDDPRVTRVGNFLRRWSLDELPQLINVLTGSMSLVGPRPMLPSEIELLGDEDHRRHLTKPGLTGLWQISGRKEVSWEERMRMDLHYIENWSIALDLVIIAKTTKAVITGRGAY